MASRLSLDLRRTSCLVRIFRDFNSAAVVNPLCQEVNTQSSSKGKWDLMSAVCLERKPVITKELNEIEKKVQSLMWEVELENSLKSDHELRCIADTIRAQKLKNNTLNVDMIDDALQQTGQDFLDMGLNELKKFTPANRITKADKENDNKSTHRKLDKHLVLLLNEKLGDKLHWILPFGKRLDGETMRQTAERVLAEKFNKTIQARFYGNAPCGFYKYKYPKSLQAETNILGAKVFFFKAEYLDGDVKDKKLEYTWACREELNELMLDDYNRSVSLFLIDE
uniref:Large ribosomal subunit protein mL46 n=1 Tax=Cacopsylla melanoneura TaxID=428564 RepID=A0A8D8Y964_9HEMI